MSFPTFKTWVQDVLNPRDRTGGAGPYHFETEVWHRAYFAKHAVAAAIQPGSILEIGIRYGYSAHAFLTAAPKAVYVGIDIDDPVINAMGEPTCAWALAMLRRTVPGARVAHVCMDSQADDFSEVVRPADLVHIDACHSFKGATSDITRAWPLTQRAMLIDD